ncbi:unnamed protein product, partial [Fusarium fujikuroi]
QSVSDRANKKRLKAPEKRLKQPRVQQPGRTVQQHHPEGQRPSRSTAVHEVNMGSLCEPQPQITEVFHSSIIESKDRENRDIWLLNGPGRIGSESRRLD